MLMGAGTALWKKTKGARTQNGAFKLGSRTGEAARDRGAREERPHLLVRWGETTEKRIKRLAKDDI